MDFSIDAPPLGGCRVGRTRLLYLFCISPYLTPSTGQRRMPVATDEFIIVGQTHDGKTFRPSDWADRLCGIMSAFGADQRMQYSPYVQPINVGGVKCVLIDVRLKELEPMAYNFLINFARDNELKTRPGRGPAREEDAA